MRNWKCKLDIQLIRGIFLYIFYIWIFSVVISFYFCIFRLKYKNNKDLQNLKFPSSEITVIPTKDINFLIGSLKKFILIDCFFILIKTICSSRPIIFRFKWWSNFLLFKLFPWKFCKPWMLLQLLYSWFWS